MKNLLCVSLLILASISLASAAIPKGYKPASEYEKVKANALKRDKLIAVLFKGANDACPNCVVTVENGTKALRSSCELIFTRVKAANSGKTGLPSEITDKVPQLATGASVYFYVFNPKTFDLVATGNRSVLQSDKKKIKAFKDKVRAAKKQLKES